MASFSDIKQMLGGQLLGRKFLPKVDLSGKTAVVTGGNTGIGFETAKHLVRLKVSDMILACRSVEKGNAARKAIIKEMGPSIIANIEVWPLDLADYRSVLSFGERVRSELTRLDIFVANAGVELLKFDVAEGLERTLTVNVISTILGAISVIPKLRETSERYNTQTNLTFTGSIYHIFGSTPELEIPADVDIFDALSKRDAADMSVRYALSKLILHQCHTELAVRVSSSEAPGKSRVVMNIVNPGWCRTGLARHKEEHPLGERIGFSLIGWTGEQGSRIVVYAATLGEESHGAFVSECALKPESAFIRSDAGRKIQKRVWADLTARLEKISPEVLSFIR
ncbi:NAD(P)-binding protein [Thozetella sp. PMI_491]|nr:NAD(P)-binding protein [Thozetella sp. PMI_491]